jgi:23S rRNA-/tRNA-specific pseudouridylate synthase
MGITKIEHITPFRKGGKGDSKAQKTSPSEVLLTLQILTGRTHQIRYHLSHHGLPIVGDYLYGEESSFPLQLTAYKLIYQDIDGQLQTIEVV